MNQARADQHYAPTLQPQFVTTLLGPIELVTPATTWPITAEEARDHCNQTLDDDDLLLERQIRSATHYCQKSRGRQIMTATYDVPVKAWWVGSLLRLPRPPLQSVTSIQYYDASGTLNLLDPSRYIVHKPLHQAGYIELPRSFGLPWTLVGLWYLRAFPIVIRLVAGCDSPDDVPETTKEAIYQMVDFLYENRGGADVAMPRSIEALLDVESPAGYG